MNSDHLAKWVSVVAVATGTQLSVAAAPLSGGERLDEVTIHGKRAQLDEMRRAFVQLDDRFYERYNELNRNHDFDVHCRDEVRTGTLLKKRSCSAVFEDKAFHDEGTRVLEMQQYVADQFLRKVPEPITNGGLPAMASQRIEGRRQEFRENVRAVVSGDEGLMTMLRERSELIERYDAVRREVFGLDPKGDNKKAAKGGGQLIHKAAPNAKP
jgi:hypothetical protein